MSRQVFIGIDGGGGTTECILSDNNGKLIGKGKAGGSNVFASGAQKTAEAISESMRAAGLKDGDTVLAACFGLSGVMHGVENPEITKIAHDVLPNASSVFLVSDAVNALSGALGLDPGICVNSGTGAFGIGRDKENTLAFSSGWGPLLGDEGSGYWIGSQGLTAALRSFDQRADETILLNRLLDALEVENCQKATIKIYQKSSNSRILLSNLCPVILECATGGDPVALGVIENAGKELALAALGVARQLDLVNEEIKIVPLGNCLLRSPVLKQSFLDNINICFEKPILTTPMFSPSIGSLLLALAKEKVKPTEAVLRAYEKM
jgi:N-acetylmuramic acid 6-phosphate etherase